MRGRRSFATEKNGLNGIVVCIEEPGVEIQTGDES